MSELDFTVRRYVDEDAPHLARLYFESAQTLGRRRYSAEQVDAWAPSPADADTVQLRASDGRLTLVASAADGMALAFGDLEPDGHIDHLYAHPLASGRGVAGAVLDALIKEAAEKGITQLHVEASELARGLFERKGFAVIRRRDFEVRGVAIHNYAMKREL